MLKIFFEKMLQKNLTFSETEENQHFLLSIKKVMILLFVEALMV